MHVRHNFILLQVMTDPVARKEMENIIIDPQQLQNQSKEEILRKMLLLMIMLCWLCWGLEWQPMLILVTIIGKMIILCVGIFRTGFRSSREGKIQGTLTYKEEQETCVWNNEEELSADLGGTKWLQIHENKTVFNPTFTLEIKCFIVL